MAWRRMTMRKNQSDKEYFTRIRHAVGRTLAGVYEVATFPFPGPTNFEPLVQPEFVVQPDRAGERSDIH